MGIINCCRECVPPKRHTACWGHCPEYLAEKELHERKKAEYEKELKITGAIWEERRRKMDKAIKGHRKI